MIDRAALLARLKREVTALEDDMRVRVGEVDEMADHLSLEHDKAVDAGRTAMSLLEWQEGEITQAAVAWVLGCVFVRFLEDNHLVDQALLSGPGDRRAAALGRREEYFRSHPEHSDREYLEAAFREVARYPSVAALYDERHNPLWRLGPTADGARALRELWTEIDPETGDLVYDFTDERLDTRFLGDLYQDLSEAAKKRYALLQTPIFVEEFILDRTLDPAIAEFGLEQVRLIDPTCGSGHFLIGAFERIFGLWQEREPGTTTTVLAQRALDAVYGVDLNPYATAIARFRLLIVALRVCKVGRLAEAPAFRFNLATGDSLLHGTRTGQLFGGAVAHGTNVAHVFDTEDAADLDHILGQGYHAVVGNPPYIAVSDSALRDAYRDRYESCHGKYVLTVPFMERFFELAHPEATGGRGGGAGFVGKITGNNFMRREFGAPLVEKFLPSVDLQTIIDTSAVSIPGHGTPTVILFGRNRPPVSSTLRILDGIRGEPGQSGEPAHSKVWSSIVRFVDAPGQQDPFIRSSDVPRRDISTHPMTLGIGRELRKRLESHAETVASVIDTIGFLAISAEDDVFARPPRVWRRLGANPAFVCPLVTGDLCRDWVALTSDAVLFPYKAEELAKVQDLQADKGLWRYRSVLWARQTFSRQTYRAAGRPWWEWHQTTLSRLRASLTITWGEVATHNHFALDRGGKVFKQTAPVIKLPEATSVKQHLGLLGVLNSSAACFWLREICQDKPGYDEPFEARFAFNSSNVAELPLPVSRSPMLPARLDALASERAELLDGCTELPANVSLSERLTELGVRDGEIFARMVSIQEEMDWQLLVAYGIAPHDLPVLGEDAPPIGLGQRAFEIVLARQLIAGDVETTWFKRHGSKPITEIHADWPADYRQVVQRRIDLIGSDADIALIERPENKRRWNGKSWEERQTEALRAFVFDRLEAAVFWDSGELLSAAHITDLLRNDRVVVEAIERLAGDRDASLGTIVDRLMSEASVPYLAGLRFNAKGLRKRMVWERMWALQRAEDRIDVRTGLAEGDPRRLTYRQADALKSEKVGVIPIPPRYALADFLSAKIWSHRGKLDVPNERFIFYPKAGRGSDSSSVFGWGGWNERDRARALATRIIELREQDAAGADRLTPLLAGILELLPWIHQWHPDVDPTYGGPPGTFFEDWLDQQLAELSLTREALRGWRPPEHTRGRRKRVAA